MTSPNDLSTGQLVSGLLNDVRTLLRQELALARAEIREELGKAIAVLVTIAAAAGALALAGLWILIAITRGIASMFGWPLGGVYAVIGALLAVVGLVLLALAWHQVKTFRVLPQTRETLVEQVTWSGRRTEQRA